jgi:4-hydroxy-tetrahydrodipicolinate synthase
MLSGDDSTGLGYIAHGGHGCISVTANVAPEACAAFYNALLAGDYVAARRLQARLIALHKALFLEPSPGPTKFALSQLGLCSEQVRLPITACTDAVKPQILAAMAEAALA